MSDTQQLIDTLAQDADAVKPLATPGRLAMRLTAVLAAYGLVLALALGIRDDLALQLTRPIYLAEMVLLLAVLVSSIAAAVHAAFPDQYQHPYATRLPFLFLLLFAGLLLLQHVLPADPLAVIAAGPDVHIAECTLCIAAVALLPSALAFHLLRQGASTRPAEAGCCAVLAAAATGCLLLRVSEANDALAHLVLWHYLPTLGFAMLGATVGKYVIKW